MSKIDIQTLLLNDPRFQKQGSAFQKTCNQLAEIFSQSEVIDNLKSSIKCIKNAAFFLNILQYSAKRRDSIAFDSYSLNQVVSILKSGFYGVVEYEQFTDIDLQNELKDDFINYKDIEIEEYSTSRNKFLAQILTQNTFEPSDKTEEYISSNSQIDDLEDYWIQSVRLDFPYIPQPNGLSKYAEFKKNSQQYCIYNDSVIPWNQSQISVATDVNAFSDEAILNLFPKIRLYTRSPYMYQKYHGLDYDEDLGVILKISGFTKKQIKKNIIEYPHIVHIDRWVKQKGKEVTIPFWKHIELDGEIFPTASVWDKLPDTKNLPQTESFMNEYVVRKYLLERDKGIKHNYPMRGSLESFLTLYATPSYYENYKYDPITIGRQCVRARVSFKQTRNPILKMIHDSEK